MTAPVVGMLDWSNPLASSLVAAWLLDEDTTNTLVKDYSGNGYNAVLAGGRYTEDLHVEGQSGYGAFDYNGASDYVIDDDAFWDSLFTTGQPWSVSFWVYLDVKPADQVKFIHKTQMAPSRWLDFVYYTDMYGVTNKWHVGMYDGTNSVSGDVSQDDPTGQWHHFAVTYDGNSDLKLYIDLVPGTKTIFGTVPNFGNTVDLQIGESSFGGKLDAVMIFNRVLTADEVQQLYEDSMSLFADAEAQSLPAEIIEDVIQPYSGGAWMHLAEIHIPGQDVIRIARNTEDVLYADKMYVRHNFNIGAQEKTSDGSVPRLSLQIAQGKAQVPIEGLLAWWGLDDDKATTLVLDNSGNGYHGTLVGGDNTQDKQTVGKVRGAFNLNGTDDAINCGTSFATLDQFSIFCWVKPQTDFIGYGHIVSTRGSGGGNTGWMLQHVSGSGALRAYVHDGSWKYASGGTLVLNTWSFVGFTCDGSYIIPYFNGQAGTPVAYGGTITNGDALMIGMNLGVGEYFKGVADQVMIFNMALTANDVKLLYDRHGLSMLTLAQTVEEAVNLSQGAVGGIVKLIKCGANFLDSSIPALESVYSILGADSDDEWVTLSLGIPNPLLKQIPQRIYANTICPWAKPLLFKGPECGYLGGETSCTGTYEDCYTNKNNAARYGGDIGIDPGAMRK